MQNEKEKGHMLISTEELQHLTKNLDSELKFWIQFS